MKLAKFLVTKSYSSNKFITCGTCDLFANFGDTVLVNFKGISMEHWEILWMINYTEITNRLEQGACREILKILLFFTVKGEIL